MQIPLLVPAFSSQGYMPTIGIAGSQGNSRVIFWRSSILFSTAAALFYTPTSTTQGPISAHFHQRLVFSDHCCCCNSSPSGCEAASHCGTGFSGSSLKKHSGYFSILAISLFYCVTNSLHKWNSFAASRSNCLTTILSNLSSQFIFSSHA